jgi:hypothetical protein
MWPASRTPTAMPSMVTYSTSSSAAFGPGGRVVEDVAADHLVQDGDDQQAQAATPSAGRPRERGAEARVQVATLGGITRRRWTRFLLR